VKFVVETERGETEAGKVVLPRSVAKMIEALDLLEAGRMVNIGRLSERVGLSKPTLQNHVSHPALNPYRIRIGYNEVYYASRATVEEWRKDEGRDKS